MYLKLTEIQELSNKLMLPFDIAEIIEVDKNLFISELNDFASEIRRAFYRGFLLREKKIKDSIYPNEIIDIENDIPEIFDADMAQLQLSELKEFKAKLTIQLHA